jgi:hypothetical protein
MDALTPYFELRPRTERAEQQEMAELKAALESVKAERDWWRTIAEGRSWWQRTG